MVTELRNRHNQGDFAGGINVRNGTISDMWAEKIVQPLLVNTSEIQLATECVGMILKIGTFCMRVCVWQHFILNNSPDNSHLSNNLLCFPFFLTCRRLDPRAINARCEKGG